MKDFFLANSWKYSTQYVAIKTAQNDFYNCTFSCYNCIIRHQLHTKICPVLTATHHSYGSPKLSDFFRLTLEVRQPNRFWRKWLKRRAFTQGCAFCSKNRTPWSPGPLKGQNFAKFLDLEHFSLDLAFNIRGPEREHPLFFIGAQWKWHSE